MLFVFMLAAAVAIVLYRELPRVVFESQRTKEDKLIDSGEQYKRAIQLYVRKFKRFPSEISDLESTQNIRFLRRRYKDPLTGKDEWRLIHTDGNVLTDSKVQKNPAQQGQQSASTPNNFIGETQLVATAAVGEALNSRLNALAQRPSDRPMVDANAPMGQPQSEQPAIVPGQPYQFPTQPGPGMPFPQVATGQPGAQPQPQYPQQFQPQPIPVFPQQGQQPFFPGQNQPPNTPTNMYPTAPVSSQAGGLIPRPIGGGAQTLQGVNVQANTAAIDMIQRALTQPRPGGFPGVQTQTQSPAMGGGIAGVASKFEGETIKVYNDREKFEEWEFVYDMKNDKTLTQGQGGLGVPGQGQQGPMRPGQNPQQNSPFGSPQFPGQRPTLGSPMGPPQGPQPSPRPRGGIR